MQKTVYLVDASIYIFRAWFSVPDTLLGENDMPINAAYGFTRFLTELLEKTQATHVGIAFDESLTQSFRNDIYPAYKMNRELPPEELAQQFLLCRRVAEAAGLFCIGHARYEADDLIATMAANMRKEGFNNVVVSGDKDLTQVLRDQDIFWDFARNQRLDLSAVKDKFGVDAAVIQDYLGLCGDAVDNIPGVPGVGPKTAVGLLNEFSDLDGIYANLASVHTLPIRGAKTLADKLQRHEKQARLSKQLATVAYNAPISCSATSLQRQCAETAHFKELIPILGGRGEGLFQRLIQASREHRHAALGSGA